MYPLYMTDLETLGVIWLLSVISWIFIQIVGGVMIGNRVSGTKYQTVKPSARLPAPNKEMSKK